MTVPFALAQQFGLSCVLSNEWAVRFENGSVFLSVNFDNGRSYELGVELGKKKSQKPERPFSLVEVLRLRSSVEAQAVDGIMTSDPSRLSHALGRLSSLTAQYASDFLLGNDFSFVQVAKLRERESDAYAPEGSLRTARARSEAAWAKRDNKSIIDAL